MHLRGRATPSFLYREQTLELKKQKLEAPALPQLEALAHPAAFAVTPEVQAVLG